MSFKILDFYKNETKSGFLDRCYIDFVSKIALEYNDSKKQTMVKKWEIEEIRKHLDWLDDDLNIVRSSRYYAPPPKNCHHTHTVSITEENLGGEVVKRCHNCTQCGINLTEEEKNEH